MNLQETFKTTFENLGRQIAKHSPELLAGAGIGCWIAATISAVKATPKALEAIEEEKYKEAKEELTPVETVKVAGKLYLLPAVCAVAGTTCIVLSVTESNRRYIALSTAYQVLDETSKLYREKVKETISEKKEQEIQGKVAQEKLDKNPMNATNVFVSGNSKSLCFDTWSGRYFDCDVWDLKRIENEMNFTLRNHNYFSLNEYYTKLNGCGAKLELLNNGYDFGWDIDNGQIELQLSSKLTDKDEPCLVIDYWPEPRPNCYQLYQ